MCVLLRLEKCPVGALVRTLLLQTYYQVRVELRRSRGIFTGPNACRTHSIDADGILFYNDDYYDWVGMFSSQRTGGEIRKDLPNNLRSLRDSQ